MSRKRTYWICQLGGWSFYAVANVGLALLFQPLSWKVLVINLTVGASGLAFTHVYRNFAQRQGWPHLPLRRLIPRVLLVSIAIALAMTGFTLVGLLLAFRVIGSDTLQAGVVFMMVFNLSATILLWSLIYFGLHYFWNYRQAEVERWRLEAAVKDAELKALKSQLNPHFLFNSLNSVRALIAEDPKRAQQVVTQLASLLRYALQSNRSPTVPLAAELKTVRTYLALETVRLEERLRYHIAAEEAALDVPVPTMLVQTLVENGIKHGVSMRPGGGRITVEAGLDGPTLAIRVESSGRLQTSSDSTGVGLHNATQRLRLLFGERATLTLTNTSGDTVAANVHIPLRPADRRGNRHASCGETSKRYSAD